MKAIILGILLFPLSLQGSAKTDFIKAAIEQCKIDEKAAKKLATPGRVGNVFKYRMCLENPLRTNGKCTITCVNRGAKIGK